MRLPIAAAAILVTALAGCGGDSEKPEAAEIKAGDCIAKDIADEDDRAPDLASVVPCSEPHVYEILDVVDLPKEALSGKTDKEKLANRKDLATIEEGADISKEYEAFWEFTGKCDTALRETTGYDDVAVNSVSAEESILWPAVAANIHTPWANVTPKEQWLDGKRQLICSARFVDPGADSDENAPVKPVSSPNEKPLLSGMGSASFPIEFRPCDDDKAVSQFVGCDKQHHAEMLFNFEAGPVLEEQLVTTLENELKGEDADPTQLPKDVHDELDRICTEALPSVMDDGYDKKVLTGKGFVSDPFDEYNQMIVCGLVPVDSTKELGPGSLVWTDGTKVELIDAK
ncbi:MAG: hypothetical protein WAL70_14665 [Aeromicrobium sp.]